MFDLNRNLTPYIFFHIPEADILFTRLSLVDRNLQKQQNVSKKTQQIKLKTQKRL